MMGLTLSTCSTAPRPPLVARTSSEVALAAAERFYAAETPGELEAAAAAAWEAAPDSALAHELYAELDELKADTDGRFNHLAAALGDLNDDDALLHLHQLCSNNWSKAQRPRGLALLLELSEHHADPEVRALAVAYATFYLGQDGALAERQRLLDTVPGRLPTAIVGTWDNDQGKAFDQVLDPESNPSLAATYEGRSHALSWRVDPPLDPRGRLDFTDLLQPTRWMAAFIRSDVTTDEGTYALRLTTTDPLKVWVDGELVFSAVHISDSVHENVVVPLTLTAGTHAVLAKSAQRDGSWLYSARLTPLSSARAAQVKDVPSLLQWRVARVSGQVRQLAHRQRWAQSSAGGTNAVITADGWAKTTPTSLLARVALIDALWFNQERGRTADALTALDRDVGEQLPMVRLRQTRFNTQQGLKTKAREQLVAFTSAHPDIKEGFSQLADVYQSEGWSEDELKLERKLVESFSPTIAERQQLAQTLMRDGRRVEAKRTLQELFDELPGHLEGARRLVDLAVDEGDLRGAMRLQRWRLEVWPVDLSGWLALADFHRRAHDYEGAQAALAEAQRLSPDSAQAYAARAALAYEQGDTGTAVKLWRAALALNPDDERLANRLDFLSPQARLPWLDDVPTEAELQRIIDARKSVRPQPGADTAYLLDHEVTQLNSDGSSNNVVTVVAVALNQAGRDALTKQSLPGSGRVRVLHAWAIDPLGQRTEASDERGKQIFFRNLQVGSTVVLQYRHDASATGFLSRYLTKNWRFQGLNDQRVRAELVLWAPLSTKLHERTVADVKRVEEVRGNQLRLSWSTAETPPLVYEPAMPSALELAANVRISSVPDWGVWLSWERALLEGAFRSSPELDEVAKRLANGSSEPAEAVRRVHQFVMQEIRYQQDYESFIAGVRPHPAPVVLERKYGDCKDKAVLFITLAKQLGVKAHFALVRTRDSGPLDRDVPMQQFNHAIVYVPEQPGIAAGRFYDPTADLLDLDALRTDDAGTDSLVFDPETGSHAWREIAFQSSEYNAETSQLTLQLNGDGSAEGSLAFTAVGRSGSSIRRAARNVEALTQLMQRDATQLVAGATTAGLSLDEVKDLRAPAAVSVKLSAKTAARAEGELLRFKLPSDFNPRTTFALATRRHPLVLGAPTEFITRTRLTLPEGYAVSKLPSAGSLEQPCLSYARSVTPEGAGVLVEQRVRFLCERISAAEYPAYRELADGITRFIDDELVVGPAKKMKTVKAAR